MNACSLRIWFSAIYNMNEMEEIVKKYNTLSHPNEETKTLTTAII